MSKNSAHSEFRSFRRRSVRGKRGSTLRSSDVLDAFNLDELGRASSYVSAGDSSAIKHVQSPKSEFQIQNLRSWSAAKLLWLLLCFHFYELPWFIIMIIINDRLMRVKKGSCTKLIPVGCSLESIWGSKSALRTIQALGVKLGVILSRIFTKNRPSNGEVVNDLLTRSYSGIFNLFNFYWNDFNSSLKILLLQRRLRSRGFFQSSPSFCLANA